MSPGDDAPSASSTQYDASAEETLDASAAAGTAAPALETPSEKGYDASRYQDERADI
jgi:hypothetical protein